MPGQGQYKNIRLKNYFRMSETNPDKFDNYRRAVRYLTMSNKISTFEIRSLMDLSFIKIRTIQQIVSNDFDIIKLISEVAGLTEKKILNIRIFQFFAFYNFVINELERIANAENNDHDYSPDSKELTAGIDSLYRFGVFAEIDGLADGDITKHNEIGNMPYHVIFTKISLNLEKNKFEKRYYKAISNANK